MARSAFRFMVFVPPDSLAAVKNAVAAEGGARLGLYSDVFWASTPGVEQYRPGEGARPTLGRVGELSEVPSTQLVFCVPKDQRLVERIVRAIKVVHPWEEPVIFIEETMIC